MAMHDMSIRILTFSHQMSSHDLSHMNLPLAIHQDILCDDSSYKKKLMSFEYCINIV